MTIKVPQNATKAQLEDIFTEVVKNNPQKKSKDFAGKFNFKIDSLAFQRDLR
jgi:hypothetical protein